MVPLGFRRGGGFGARDLGFMVDSFSLRLPMESQCHRARRELSM